jgi:hypothetical protein
MPSGSTKVVEEKNLKLLRFHDGFGKLKES